ncbi:hypothetical protein [Sphingobacterium corticibacterium]|uniref:Uncharacterized protein n=1 Tax=Sphingobacterium corticibacterium TaxID=2484746 RepID=A0A4V2DCL4_9SPHI|nr:hypothetical protein [Sphingobacterium corticibacterium]RZF61898.1 hypothetical protein EWE74_03490 [Sphingobacterium corticibacterium]
MIWVVDDQEIEVLFSAKEEVEICRWNEYKKIIQVPLSMQKAEAIWTIRNFLQTRISDTTRWVEERLEVFDKHWPMKLSSNKQTPYIKEGIIHCYIMGRQMSATGKIRIKEELLQQFALREVGHWEETLNLLIPYITFRKNKNKPYVVQRQKGSICVDKALYNLSLEAITYCLFNAVADYGVLGINRRRQLIEKHFPRWEALEKVIRYAYASYESP